MTMRGRMGRAALLVSGGILVSRILGLFRDVVLAARLGDTPQGDAYTAAFLIPDFLNYLLAGGFLAITFIPMMSRHLAAGDEDGAWRSFSSVFRPLAIFIVALTLVAVAAARPLVDLVYGFAGGFEGVQLDEVTRLTRLVLPAQIFFVLGALFMAVQYAHQRFLIPTLAPIVYNLGIIVGGLAGTSTDEPDATGFILGAVAGAFVGNFALQWWGAGRVGLRWVSDGRRLFNADFVEYLTLALPLMIGQSVVVLDEQLTRVFGSLGDEGSVFALGSARRLNMVPVGLIAQAAGVAAYPFLARLAAEDRSQEMRATVSAAVRYVVVIGLAATALVLAVAQPAVRVAFQRGQFSPEGTAVAAAALAFYSLSIPAWGGQQVYARGFYAYRKMWTPVIVGSAWTVLAIPAFIAGFEWLDVPGLALASSAAVIGYAVTLAVLWHRQRDPEGVSRVVRAIARAVPAAIGASAAGWFTAAAITGGPIASFWTSVAAIVAATLVTGFVFVALGAALRSEELNELLRRRRSTA